MLPANTERTSSQEFGSVETSRASNHRERRDRHEVSNWIRRFRYVEKIQGIRSATANTRLRPDASHTKGRQPSCSYRCMQKRRMVGADRCRLFRIYREADRVRSSSISRNAHRIVQVFVNAAEWSAIASSKSAHLLHRHRRELFLRLSIQDSSLPRLRAWTRNPRRDLAQCSVDQEGPTIPVASASTRRA